MNKKKTGWSVRSMSHQCETELIIRCFNFVLLHLNDNSMIIFINFFENEYKILLNIERNFQSFCFVGEHLQLNSTQLNSKSLPNVQMNVSIECEKFSDKNVQKSSWSSNNHHAISNQQVVEHQTSSIFVIAWHFQEFIHSLRNKNIFLFNWFHWKYLSIEIISWMFRQSNRIKQCKR